MTARSRHVTFAPALHQETQRSQDALTHFVIPRSALPLLHGQYKPPGRIFREERGHLPGKRFAEDRGIDFMKRAAGSPYLYK